MKLGLLYEVQIPKPWTPGIEARTYGEVIEQVVLADQLGWGYVWAVEHHLLPQWSHCPAPEVLFGALTQRTSRIRIGHGIALLPRNFNQALRIAERAAVLDSIDRVLAEEAQRQGPAALAGKCGRSTMEHRRMKHQDVARRHRP